MALLAGYCAVLARTTGQRDLVVGTFSAGRRAAELDGTVGLFVNTLALRTTVDPDEPWARLLARVRRTALAAYRHEQVPFDQVVAALAPPRDPTRNPVAQAAFQVLGPLDCRVDLPGVIAEPYAQGQGGQPFDVTVTMRERGSRLDGELHLPAGLLPGTDPAELAAAFTRFVADSAARPGLPVRRLG
jgi:non-ribosomal peptide synthetase component F